MSLLYLDTSALLKRYIEEEESEAVHSVLLSSTARFISWLSDVEVKRILRIHRTSVTGSYPKNNYNQDINSEYFTMQPINKDTYIEAASIVEKTQCRSLDALHLAVIKQFPFRLELVSFDKQQIRAAKQLDMAVLNI